jgi:hypothetical protein
MVRLIATRSGSTVATANVAREPIVPASQPDRYPTLMPPASTAMRPRVWIWPISSSLSAVSTLSASATTSWTMKPTVISRAAAR